jgi:hypothetical protein
MDGGATLGLLELAADTIRRMQKTARGKNAKSCHKYMYFSEKTD